MFLGELDERSARLIEGAKAARSETVDPDLAGAMMREGHTIKGTSRVMGYEAVSVAGQLIEHVWRALHRGEMEGGIEISRALEMAARAIPDAGRGDPDAPSGDLAEAIAWLGELCPDMEVPDLPPPVPPTAAPAEANNPDVGGSGAEMAVDEPEQRRPVLELVRADDAVARAGDEPSAAAGHPLSDDRQGSPGPVEELGGETGYTEDTSSPGEDGGGTGSHGATSEDTGPVTSATSVATYGSADLEAVRVGQRSRAPRSAPGGDLGLLVQAVEDWAHDHTVMVNAGRLFEMMNHIAELRIEAHGLVQRIDAGIAEPDGPAGRAARAGSRAMRVAAERLQVEALGLGAVPVDSILSPLPQLARFLAGKLGRSAKLEMVIDDHLAADREVLDRIAEAVRQLVVNAIYHGIEDPELRTRAGKPEEGVVTISAVIKDRMLEVVVADDGAGVDWDLVRGIAVDENRLPAESPDEFLRGVLFQPGFTTRDADGGLGGGLGLDTVATAVESLYGRVLIESTPGRGTEVRITVPALRSLQRMLVVDAGGVGWGVPEAAVESVMPVGDLPLEDVHDGRVTIWRGHRVPLRSLAAVMGADEHEDEPHVVMVHHRLGYAALTVSAVDGVREVAVKELSSAVAAPAHVTGAAFLGGEDIVLVVDPGSLVAGENGATAVGRPKARVLVVDDSMGARAVVSGSLASSGFTTSVAASVAEAIEVLAQIQIDALVVDYSMPNADGVALVEAVRARHNRLPIVMLSGVADEADRERARVAGVDAFFDKAAFREGALAETLWQMLNQ